MGRRIESEKKYFCIRNDELLNEIKAYKFKLINSGFESDEYFTDINSEYIRNRTCLRIRKTNNEKMQITFKGKSKDFNNSFCKLETNYEVDPEKYNDYINLFSNLGYYSYTIVNKERYTYQKKKDNYSYSIMVDNIEDLGGFVEFEIICEDEDCDLNDIKKKLDEFVNQFSDLNLEEASFPYRDYVAQKLYKQYLPSKGKKGIHLNIDNFLKTYEKDFYNYYKDVMKEYTHTNVKLQGFRENAYKLTEEVEKKLLEYFDSIKVQDSNFIIIFELLKQLKKKDLHIILSTNSSKIFIDTLLKTIFKNEIIDKIIYLNNNKAAYNELKKYKIDLNYYFNVSKLDLKSTASLLLIIINNITF